MVDLFSPNEVLTVEELSERLKVQTSTIRDKVYKDEIPYFKLGSGKRAPVRFQGKQLNEWLSKNQGGLGNNREPEINQERNIKRSAPRVREGFNAFLENVENERKIKS